MKNRYSIFPIFVSVIFSMLSCQQQQSKVLKPAVTGEANEILLVLPQHRWNSSIGDTLRNDLQKELFGLPQPEPMFHLQQIPPKAFNKLLQTHRNILKITISPNEKKAQINIKKDKWASPQIYLLIKAPDNEAFLKIWRRNKHRIIDILLTTERKRLMDYFHKYRNQSVCQDVKKQFNLSLDIPVGYKTTKLNEDFAWIRKEYTDDRSLGIFIYQYEYTDTSMLHKENLLRVRDSLLKRYVPGPTKGSYMSTEHRFPPEMKEFEYKGRYTVEIRGLWRLINDFMGGPFVSQVTIDEKRNRVITVEGYVYAPDYDKRNYIRRVEGIIYSLEILNK